MIKDLINHDYINLKDSCKIFETDYFIYTTVLVIDSTKVDQLDLH